MALPTMAMVHVDPLLSNIASNWIISDTVYIAQRVFPLVQSPLVAGLIAQYDRRDLYRVHDVRPRAPGTESQGGGYRVTHTDRYHCVEWAYHKDVADEERAWTMRPMDADRDATAQVTQLLKIKRDYQWAQAAWGAGIWGTDVTGIAGATNPAGNNVRRWSDYTTPSAPQADIDYYRNWMRLATGGFEPNTLVVSPTVWDVLKNHPSIVARYVFTEGVPVLTEQMVANYLELDQIIVAKAVQNLGPEGGQWIGQYIFSEGALLCYVPPNPSITQPSAGYTFGWTGANHQGSVVTIERFRMANDAKADRIVGNFFFDVHIQENILGVFFTGLAGGIVQVVI